MTLSKTPARTSPGLATTLAYLGRTRNEAADGMLLPALDSAHRSIREGAVKALVERRSQAGQEEVLRRLGDGDARWPDLLADFRGRMTSALRNAALGTETDLCVNACQAALWMREYDLTAALITVLEDDGSPNANIAAVTLRELAERLYDELSSPHEVRARRDPQAVRRHVVGSLESSVSRFIKHKRREVVSAFLMLVARDNATLKRILQDPHHGSYLPMVDELLHGEHGGVLRLLLSFIDDPHSPSSAISVVARRTDAKFVRLVLRKVGFAPSPAAAHNFKRMESIAWLREDALRLDDWDEAEQHSAVQALAASSVKRSEAFKTIKRFVLHGKPAGRRAAAVALAEFHGAEANALAMEAVDDEDPSVQAAVAAQLRPRGIPGSLNKLVELVESPHEAVRQAARASLVEFTLDRFLASFDVLDDDVRENTGALVRKVNPDAKETLLEEMCLQSRTRRLRAIKAAAAMNVVAEVETQMFELLVDEDHIVRTEAARALGRCDTPAARAALRDALSDRSLTVQEAAEESLTLLDGKNHGFRRRATDRSQEQTP